MANARGTKRKDNTSTGSERRKQDKITLHEEYEFFILMNQVMEGMVKARVTELRPFGISPIQSGVLYVLKEAKRSLAPIKLARQLLRDPGSIHQLLDRMENNGLIRRIRDSEKKRSVQVEMTKQGEEIHRSQKNEVLPRILGRLSTEERKQLWAILKKLREATYAELSPQPSFP